MSRVGDFYRGRRGLTSFPQQHDQKSRFDKVAVLLIHSWWSGLFCRQFGRDGRAFLKCLRVPRARVPRFCLRVRAFLFNKKKLCSKVRLLRSKFCFAFLHGKNFHVPTFTCIPKNSNDSMLLEPSPLTLLEFEFYITDFVLALVSDTLIYTVRTSYCSSTVAGRI